jgi:hypothetical protein
MKGLCARGFLRDRNLEVPATSFVIMGPSSRRQP